MVLCFQQVIDPSLILVLAYLGPRRLTAVRYSTSTPTAGEKVASEDTVPDFSISDAFMAELFNQDSLNFTVKATTIDHSGVHQIGSDREMHVAATPTTIGFGMPADIVVEPPNLCKIENASNPNHVFELHPMLAADPSASSRHQ